MIEAILEYPMAHTVFTLLKPEHQMLLICQKPIESAFDVSPFLIRFPCIFLFLYLVIHSRHFLHKAACLGRTYPEEPQFILHRKGVEHLFQGGNLPPVK